MDYAELNDLLRRLANGEEVPDDKLREAVAFIREARGKKLTPTTTTKRRGKKSPPDLSVLDGVL